MLQEVLTAVLKREHRDAGLYLDEDEDFLYLKRGKKTLAMWYAWSATIEEIWTEADKYLVGICSVCGCHRANTIEMLGEDCGHKEG